MRFVARAAAFPLVAAIVLIACSSDNPVTIGPLCKRCESNEECDDHLFCNGTETCEPQNPLGDCHSCVHTGFPCEGNQRCDEVAQRCVAYCPHAFDQDGDGHNSSDCGGDDCDDNDPRRFPGNPETCDGDPNHDEDCDPETYGNKDTDKDGYVDSVCCNTGGDGSHNCGLDCDDNNAGVHPGLPELCNNRDDNCDGNIDEGAKVTLYVDADHDGYGAPGPGSLQCPGTAGYSAFANDCDDTNPAMVPGVFYCSGAANTDAVAICDWNGVTPGTYFAGACAKGLLCAPQPNGTGVCR